ncbi:MAG: NifU family protein [Tepidisphaeraceae bacterium]
MTEKQDGRRQIVRLESLIHQVERFTDPKAREQTREIVQALLDLHNSGLERILEKVAETGPTGLVLIDSLAQDELVGGLLLLYGLHPLDLDTRVQQGLDQARPYLRSHGGNVELLGIADGVVQLRMQGSCHGCPSSAVTLKTTIEEAIYEKAPDVTSIEIEAEVVQKVEVALSGIPGRSRMALPILSQ